MYSSKFNIEDLTTSTQFIKFEQSTLDLLPEIKPSNSFLLQNVILKDNNIIFFITKSFRSNNITVSSTALGYSLDNEFKWIRQIETVTDNETNFISLTQPNEVLIYFTIHQIDESKMITKISEEKMLIGYSILDPNTGDLIEKKEIQIDRNAYFRLAKLINDRFYCLYFKKRGISSLGVFTIE